MHYTELLEALPLDQHIQDRVVQPRLELTLGAGAWNSECEVYPVRALSGRSLPNVSLRRNPPRFLALLPAPATCTAHIAPKPQAPVDVHTRARCQAVVVRPGCRRRLLLARLVVVGGQLPSWTVFPSGLGAASEHVDNFRAQFFAQQCGLGKVVAKNEALRPDIAGHHGRHHVVRHQDPTWNTDEEPVGDEVVVGECQRQDFLAPVGDEGGAELGQQAAILKVVDIDEVREPVLLARDVI
mmetsp:Transcript_16564/g.47158  ORF Transcript_16564/g.47158 Transcript_16564/m.47158 type:complete len:240 (-) Transcript_16564:19-738(-)